MEQIKRATEQYRLPSGRIVAVHEDVSRGKPAITFTQKDGEVVVATAVSDFTTRLAVMLKY